MSFLRIHTCERKKKEYSSFRQTSKKYNLSKEIPKSLRYEIVFRGQSCICLDFLILPQSLKQHYPGHGVYFTTEDKRMAF